MVIHWKVIKVHPYLQNAIMKECKDTYRNHYRIPSKVNVTNVTLIHNMIEFYTGKEFQNDKLI